MEVLGAFGLSWEDLRVRHLKDVFFSKGLRPALFFAEGLVHAAANDELEHGRKKVTLSFEITQGGLRDPRRQTGHRCGHLNPSRSSTRTTTAWRSTSRRRS